MTPPPARTSATDDHPTGNPGVPPARLHRPVHRRGRGRAFLFLAAVILGFVLVALVVGVLAAWLPLP